MKFPKKFLPLVLVFFLAAGSVFAQGQQQQMMQQQQPDPIPADSVTEADLKAMVEIDQALRPVMMDAQQKQRDIVQEADSITLERFNKYVQSMQSGQGNVQLTAAEKSALQSIQPKLMQINQQMQKQRMEVLQGSDLNMTRIQRLSVTLQSNQDVRQRYQSMVPDTTDTGGGNGGGNR